MTSALGGGCGAGRNCGPDFVEFLQYAGRGDPLALAIFAQLPLEDEPQNLQPLPEPCSCLP